MISPLSKISSIHMPNKIFSVGLTAEAHWLIRQKNPICCFNFGKRANVIFDRIYIHRCQSTPLCQSENFLKLLWYSILTLLFDLIIPRQYFDLTLQGCKPLSFLKTLSRWEFYLAHYFPCYKVRVFKIANICKEMIFFSAMKGFVHQHYQHHRPESWVSQIHKGWTFYPHCADSVCERHKKGSIPIPWPYMESMNGLWYVQQRLVRYCCCCVYNIMKWGGWCWYASSMPCFHCWD